MQDAGPVQVADGVQQALLLVVEHVVVGQADEADVGRPQHRDRGRVGAEMEDLRRPRPGHEVVCEHALQVGQHCIGSAEQRQGSAPTPLGRPRREEIVDQPAKHDVADHGKTDGRDNHPAIQLLTVGILATTLTQTDGAAGHWGKQPAMPATLQPLDRSMTAARTAWQSCTEFAQCAGRRAGRMQNHQESPQESPMSNSNTKVLEKLEAQVAYNEKMLNDLSAIVAEQGRDIDKLKAEIEVLGREVLQITEGEVGSH
jgi:uncharacterized coiled-coil protein SlyX